MDDDWESEDFVPPPPSIAREQPKSQRDDEDVAEEEEVKESWEDEEKPKPAKPTASALQKAKPEKKKVVVEAKKALTPEEEVTNQLEEKLRQQRLVEESDYQSTTELFGRREGDRSVDNFIPKSESDFVEYAELLAQKIRPYEKSFHYMTLLKALMRHAMISLKASDAKEVSSTASIIANEKLKAEKEAAAGKKKTGPKKKQLHVDKPDEDSVLTPYDDVDDHDFM